MKVYTYSQARQHLSQILNQARSEEVFIRRRGGEVFRVAPEVQGGSPFVNCPFEPNRKLFYRSSHMHRIG